MMTKREARSLAKEMMAELRSGDTLGIVQIRARLDSDRPELIGKERELAELAVCRAVVELVWR